MALIAYPNNMTFGDWVASLQLDISQQLVPSYTGGDWKDWVRTTMFTSPIFNKTAVPSPDNFSTWQEWAQNAVGCLT